MMKRLVLFFFLFALTACGGTTPAPSARVEMPAAHWQIDASGNAFHLPSDIAFPPRIGDYERTGLTDYAADGSDVSATYRNPKMQSGNFLAEITIYVTSLPGVPVKDYLAGASQAILERWPETEFVQDGDFQSKTGAPSKGPYRLYRVTLGDLDVRTGVWVTRKDQWLLKARFTYPEVEDEAMAMISAMLNKAMAEAGSDKGVRVTTQNAEGVAPDMDHVTKALQQVLWSVHQ